MYIFKESIKLVFQGSMTNILITVFSCILPLIAGVAINYLCSQSKEMSTVSKLGGILFESICPPIMLIAIYFIVFGRGNVNSTFACILGFNICFIGYIPAHYNENYSFKKNTIVNGIGLVSNIFKWSFISYIIGGRDILRNTMMFLQSFSKPFIPILLASIVSFSILFILKMAKFIAEQIIVD